MHFKDRNEAGQKLAAALSDYKDKNVVVYALPRGGVPVAAPIAKALAAPLELTIARKIGHPLSPECAIGAVSEDGQRVMDEDEEGSLDPDWLKEVTARELTEAKRRRQLYGKGRSPISPVGSIVILVDDGVATGLTMQAALLSLAAQGPREVVVAVPVIAADTAKKLRQDGQRLVALFEDPAFLGGVGSYYDSFVQVSDEDVVALLS